MSLESKIETLNATIERLIAALEKNASTAAPTLQASLAVATAPVVPAVATAPVVPAVVPTPVAPIPIAPAVAPAVVPTPVAPIPAAPTPTVAATMPVAPFGNGAAAPAAIPFTDQQGLIQYLMTTYRELGSKGVQIQQVINSLGVANVNEVTPDMYPALVRGIEALKAA